MSGDCTHHPLSEDRWGHKATFPSWAEGAYENVAEGRNHDDAQIVVCQMGDVPIGYTIFWIEFNDLNLHYVVRDASRRAHRIGDRLWAYTRDLAGDLTVKAIAASPSGLRFLLRQRFVPDGRIPGASPLLKPEWSWSRRRSPRKILSSDVAGSLFDELNRHYFQANLARYRVDVVQAIAGERPSVTGQISIEREVITTRETHDARELAGVLLHEMAHASVGYGHEERYFKELERLTKCEAPLRGDDDVSGITYEEYVERFRFKEDLLRLAADEAAEREKLETEDVNG